MFQPAYYLGRRYHTMRATSHPVNYTYVFVRQGRFNSVGRFYPTPRTRLAHTEAYWRDRRRYPL